MICVSAAQQVRDEVQNLVLSHSVEQPRGYDASRDHLIGGTGNDVFEARSYDLFKDYLRDEDRLWRT